MTILIVILGMAVGLAWLLPEEDKKQAPVQADSPDEQEGLQDSGL